MEESPTAVQIPSSKISKSRISIILPVKIIAVVLFIILPVLGFYLGLKFNKQNSISYTLLKDGRETMVPSDVNIINDIKKLGSEIIVSDWQTKFAVYLLRRDEPIDYQPYGKEGGSLLISDDLVILNLQTGERQTHIFSQNQIPTQIIEFLKDVTPEGGSHYRLHPEILRWSPFTENTFWGKLSIYSNGDPPVANEIGFFKMDIPNSKIETYAIPYHGLFGAINENTNAEKVLYERVREGLSLYLYNLETKEDRLIVSYDKTVFDKYCSSFIEYVYTSGFYGDCGRDRGLRVDWDGKGKGISYFDFLTQKKIYVSIE